MKIKSIRIRDFKRFKHLDVSDLPETAKLIVLIGPNGCGKSSLFDAIYGKAQSNTKMTSPLFSTYYDRIAERSDIFKAIEGVNIYFYGNQPSNEKDWENAVHARSAYRNDPTVSLNRFKDFDFNLRENKFVRMIDNDQSASQNYIHLISQAFEDLFENADCGQTLHQFRDYIVAEIRDAFQNLFPELILNSLGNPFEEGATFRFDKGDTKGLSYENLSGGEKAAFDLILDLIIKRRKYKDAIFCIDEPEAHMGMRIQQKLLSTLYQLIPDDSQLWIATHSIGIMREAHTLNSGESGKVVFLDFSGLNFDEPQEIKPAQMNHSLWENMHLTVLDDFSELIAPDILYICESTPEKSFDAGCYNQIFSSQHPDAKFFSVGSKTDVARCALILKRAIPKLRIIPLRDRDNMTEDEINDERAKGSRVLSRANIESYLLDTEVLTAFCKKQRFSNKTLKSLIKIRDSNTANLKKATQDIRTHLLQINRSLPIGDNREGFLKYSLAPLIISSMQVYKELEQDIFL